MADGMSFVFQIDSNTPGLDTLLAGLDKANVSMQKGAHGLKGIDDGSKKAGESAKGLGGAFEKLVTQGLDPFLKRAESIAEFEFIREGAEKLLEFPGELAHKLIELGEDALGTAAKTERMGRAFENALGKDVGKDAFEYFDKIADKTEFTHEQIRGMGLELAKSGFKGEGLKNAAAAIADLGSMSGNGAAGAEEATSALQRIMTTGRIEARALVPFGIQKEQFLGELGKETGLSMKAVQKEMEAGKIPIETTLNSLYTTITNKTGKDLGGAGTEMTDLLTSRLAHLKEIPDLIFEEMRNSQGYQQISDFIGDLVTKLSPDSDMGQQMISGFGAVFDRIGSDLAGIDLDSVFKTTVVILGELPDLIDGVSGAFTGMYNAFKPYVDAIGFVIENLTPIGFLLDRLGAPNAKDIPRSPEEVAKDNLYEQQKAQLREQRAALAAGKADPFALPFGPQEHTGIERMREQTKTLTNLGVMDVKGYAAGVDGSAPDGIHAMVKFGADTAEALKDSHQQHSPSQLFRGIAEMDAEGYAIGMEGSADRIADAIDTTFSPPSAAPAVTGSAGPMTVVIERIEVNIEGSGGDPYEQGRLAARGMEDELELSLARVLEGVVKRRGL